MRKNKAVAGIAGSFTACAVLVIALLLARIVSFELALLMLVALIGLYVGFGVLIIIYRFVCKLE